MKNVYRPTKELKITCYGNYDLSFLKLDKHNGSYLNRMLDEYSDKVVSYKTEGRIDYYAYPGSNGTWLGYRITNDLEHNIIYYNNDSDSGKFSEGVLRSYLDDLDISKSNISNCFENELSFIQALAADIEALLKVEILRDTANNGGRPDIQIIYKNSVIAIIECKFRCDKEDIRMALGQLKDYGMSSPSASLFYASPNITDINAHYKKLLEKENIGIIFDKFEFVEEIRNEFFDD